MLLKMGSTGNAVSVLVRDLTKLGYYAGAATSTFDNRVRLAVRAFQMQNIDAIGRPLVVDGIAGPVTLASIAAELGGTTTNPATTPTGLPAGGSATARGALGVAISEYTAGAGESGGNNKGPDVEKYLNGIVGTPNDWCAGFVSYCFSKSGQPMPFTYSVGARKILSLMRDKGWGVSPTHEDPPRPGDVITWWRIAPSHWKGHVGLVHSYANGIVTTIEGNKTPKVGKFSYTLGAIDKLLGFARVP